MKLVVRDERWPLAHAFTISRGSKTEAHVVVAEVSADGAVGRGECVPYARYGETVASVTDQIETARAAIEAGVDTDALLTLMAPGAARNAVDCALWDLEAKQTGVPAYERAGQRRRRHQRRAPGGGRAVDAGAGRAGCDRHPVPADLRTPT